MSRRAKARILPILCIAFCFGIEPTHVVHLLEYGAVATGGLFLLAGHFVLNMLNGISRSISGIGDE